MTPETRAALLAHGVLYPTIGLLETAGLVTLAQLAALDRQQLAAVDGLDDTSAATVVRAIGRLMDVEVALGRWT